MTKLSGINELHEEGINNSVASKSSVKKPINCEVKIELIRLSDVFLNYKNKRVVTQFVRFIPDEIAIDAIKEDDPEGYILEHLSSVPINNVIREFRSNNSDNDIHNYPRHDDIFNPDTEGVFIGKGICFHNVDTKNNELKETLDGFVHTVKLNGSSLTENKEVVERPQVIRVGGQKYRLVFGHQRYCYLIFCYGLDFEYYFNLSSEQDKQDLKIYLENNTKTNEYGYEQILSYYHAAKDLQKSKPKIGMSELMKSLCLQKTRYYELRPFLEDIKLIEVVKRVAINAPKTLIIDAYSSIKPGIKLLGDKDRDAVYNMFENMLLEKLSEQNNKLSNAKKKHTKKNSNQLSRLSFSAKDKDIEKILFNDVRTLTDLDSSQYDLTTNKGLKNFMKDLLEKLEENNEAE